MRTTNRKRLWNSMIKCSKMQQESFTFSSESMIRISSKLCQDTKDLLNLPYKLQLKHFLFLKDNFLPLLLYINLFNYFTDPLKKLCSHLHSNSWMVCASLHQGFLLLIKDLSELKLPTIPLRIHSSRFFLLNICLNVACYGQPLRTTILKWPLWWNTAASFETHCMDFPNQFFGFPNRVAFFYATSLPLEAMELAGHSSKQVFQPDKEISGFLQG